VAISEYGATTTEAFDVALIVFAVLAAMLAGAPRLV
jgi:hypothetical protein